MSERKCIPFDYLLGMPRRMPRKPAVLHAKRPASRTPTQIPTGPKVTLEAFLARDRWVVQLTSESES